MVMHFKPKIVKFSNMKNRKSLKEIPLNWVFQCIGIAPNNF